MFMLTVTQRGDVCHVKWKLRALCLCIWIENRDGFLWKRRYHLGHCSEDSPSRDFFFIPSVGLTEHLCYLDFHLPGERLDSESIIFPCSLVLAEIMWLLNVPFLIAIWASCTVSFDVFCKVTRTVHHACYYSNIYFVTCQSTDYYLALMHQLKSLRVLNSGGFWFAWPVCRSPPLSVLRRVRTTTLVVAPM